MIQTLDGKMRPGVLRSRCDIAVTIATRIRQRGCIEADCCRHARRSEFMHCAFALTSLTAPRLNRFLVNFNGIVLSTRYMEESVRQHRCGEFSRAAWRHRFRSRTERRLKLRRYSGHPATRDKKS